MAVTKADTQAPSLEALRARLDTLDTELLHLVDERAGIARLVAAAKAAAGAGGKFALRPARETAILRRLLAAKSQTTSAALVVRIWRELIGDSLSVQGPFHLHVWGGKDPATTTEAARNRFGAAPSLVHVAKPEEALAAARTLGGVAVCALTPDAAWWGRLLAEPALKVFSALPCLAAWGPTCALAVAAVNVEPTGGDITFWVTDANDTAPAIEAALSRDGVAASLVQAAGGLKLFGLAGFYQPHDERLARAPGRLHGVIGAAPSPLDV